MRKLIITNAILAFLLVSVFILGYYFFQYPDDFKISRYIKGAEWRPFGLIYLGLVVGAFTLSFMPLKNYSRKRKAAIFLAALQGIFLSFFIFKMVDSYRENRKDFNNLLTEYQSKADADLKSGFIEIDYAGGLELPSLQEQKMRAGIDSIRRTYGLSYRNSGCIVNAALIKAQEEYERLTKPYLDKRNGPGWERRMEQQIEEVRQKYR
jgi:hypothetical protein